VNLEQVEAGMAWHYKKYQGEQSVSDRVKYADAKREARRRKLGLWRDPDPSAAVGVSTGQPRKRERPRAICGKIHD